jgi:hypothetical protein
MTNPLSVMTCPLALPICPGLRSCSFLEFRQLETPRPRSRRPAKNQTLRRTPRLSGPVKRVSRDEREKSANLVEIEHKIKFADLH